MTPLEIARILNNPAALPHKDQAKELVAPLYNAKPTDSWYRDSRVEAVALLLYTGALVLPGASAKPDPRVAELQAKLAQIAKIAGG